MTGPIPNAKTILLVIAIAAALIGLVFILIPPNPVHEIHWTQKEFSR